MHLDAQLLLIQNLTFKGQPSQWAWASVKWGSIQRSDWAGLWYVAVQYPEANVDQTDWVVKHWSHDCTHAYHGAAVITEEMSTVNLPFTVKFKVNYGRWYFLTPVTLETC